VVLVGETYIGRNDSRGILWIDPRKVHLYCGSKHPHYHRYQGRLPRAVFRLMHLFPANALGGDWDRGSIPIEQDPKFRLVEDYARCDGRYKESLYYEALLRDLESKGCARYKKAVMTSREELDAFFQRHFQPLFSSLREKGYVMRPGDDIGAAAVDRLGRIQKAGGGNHRFFAARVLGVRPFPVRVSFVHTNWLETEGLTLKRSGRSSLLQRLQEIAATHA